MTSVLLMDPDLMAAEMAAEVLDGHHETRVVNDIERTADILRSHHVDAIVLAHSSEAPLHIREVQAVDESVPVILINTPPGVRNGDGETADGAPSAVVHGHDTPEELRRAVEQVCGTG